MVKLAILLIFITALVLTSFATPDSILKSLKTDFLYANIKGKQYAVLYLHEGDVSDPEPFYDVHKVCAGDSVNAQITKWRNRQDQGTVVVLKPPLWPTNSLKDLGCTNHPNVAIAGVDKSKPGNTGHSEYLLLTQASGALDPMLTSYKNNQKKNACPKAVLLYTFLTPCHSCSLLILATKQRINDACKHQVIPTIYLGYTIIYNPESWKNDWAMLEKKGVKILEIN